MEIITPLLEGATYEYSAKMNRRVPNALIAITDQNVGSLLPLLHKSVGFVDKTTRILGEEFATQLSRRSLSSRLLMDILKCNNSHLPRFSLFDSSTSEPYLDIAGLSDVDIRANNLLLVFQFPEIVARWHKQKYEDEQPKGNSHVSWHGVGRGLKRVVWDTVDLYSSSDLLFDRINGIGEHNSDYYYYAWEVSLPEKRGRQGK